MAIISSSASAVFHNRNLLVVKQFGPRGESLRIRGKTRKENTKKKERKKRKHEKKIVIKT